MVKTANMAVNDSSCRDIGLHLKALTDEGNSQCEKGEATPSICKNIKKFAEDTTVHGIPRVVTSQSLHKKFLWLCFVFGTFAYLLYQLYTISVYYDSRPVKTTVKLQFRELRFPAITLCNLNPIRKSKTKALGTGIMKTLSTLRDFKIKKGVSTMSRANQRNTSAERMLDDELSSMSNKIYDNSALLEKEDAGIFSEPQPIEKNYLIKQKIETDFLSLNRSDQLELGHQIDNMILECSFAGRKCFSYRGLIVTSEYGNCFTFEAQRYIATKSGPEYGMEMIINLENHEVLGTFNKGYGARLVIHEAGSFPLPAEEGIIVSSGYETSLGIKVTEIRRLGDPYGKCMQQSKSTYPKKGVKYTTQACLLHCKEQMIQDKCRCNLGYLRPEIRRHFGFEPDISFKDCRVSQNKTSCALDVTNKFLHGPDKCACYNQCHETVYSTSFSGRIWPSPEYLEELTETACQTYNTKGEPCPLLSLDEEKLKMNFLKVNLYYEDLNFETLVQEPLYDSSALLSDIGGSLGLFLGASVLSGCELVDIFIECIIALYRRIRRKRHVIQHVSQQIPLT